MSDPGEKLVGLARERFEPLTEAEVRLLRMAAANGRADCSDLGGGKDPAHSESWPEARTVRAGLIRWLCVDRAARDLVDPRGMDAEGVRVKGGIDLASVRVPFPLRLTGCGIPGGLFLDGMEAPALRLSGSRCGPFNAIGAHIGGDLSCSGSSFHNPEGDALSADRAEIGGSVFLRGGFRAEGGVRLLGATVGGTLDCSGGSFHNPEGNALSADRAEIGGSMFLRGGFHAKGGVRLPGATVGGDLDCSGARFSGAAGPDGVLHDGMNAELVRIGGTLFWQGVGRTNHTWLNLHGARAAVLCDERESWPESGRLVIHGFTYDRLAETPRVPHDARRLEWIRRQVAYHPDPYSHLAKVLREAGHEAEARKVLIAREDDRLRHGGLSGPPWAWQWFLGKTIRYGYRPFQALAMALLVIALGTTVFMDAWHTHNMVPSTALSEYNRGLDPPRGYPAFNPLIYSADAFLPIVGLYQEAYWQPNGHQGCWLWTDGTPCARWYRGYLWLHIAAGWVLTTLFVAGISGLVRRND